MWLSELKAPKGGASEVKYSWEWNTRLTENTSALETKKLYSKLGQTKYQKILIFSNSLVTFAFLL